MNSLRPLRGGRRRRAARGPLGSSLALTGLVTLALLAPLAPAPSSWAGSDQASGQAKRDGSVPTGAAVRGASVDPAAYLPRYPNAAVLARVLAERLAANGVNIVYVNAYNVKYGANYLTSYRYNVESDYGQQDLLGKLIEQAHARGIRVIAAVYDHQHRGAWEAEPSWREKTQSGGDYNPPRVDVQYFLSVGVPSFVSWWKGYLRDLLDRYPGIDGVELREPIVNWWGVTADYNPALTSAFQSAHPQERLGGPRWIRFREQSLTGFLHQEIALIHAAGRQVQVTTVASAFGSGRILSAANYASATGFDLDGLLSGGERPDAIKIEPLWQQWASLYPGPTFTPEWTRWGAAQFVRQVGGRVPVIVHVELTRWGNRQPTVQEFQRSLQAGLGTPGVLGTDFFSTALADDLGAWPAVRRVYGTVRAAPRPPEGAVKRVLILYDDGRGVAGATPGLFRIYSIFLANLLGHFQAAWDLQSTRQYQPGELAGYDVVFYQANVFGGAPPAFLQDVSTFQGTIVWIGQNLFQLHGQLALPFDQATEGTTPSFTEALYKGQVIPALGGTIVTTIHPGASVLAWLQGGGPGRVPYVIRSGHFWYVAGSPFDYVEKVNGRYLAFADLLHDMLGQDEAARHLAYLRIEDVNPLSDPLRVRQDADVFASHHAPFMVAFSPYFVDPAHHVRVSIAQRPEMLRALRYVETKGGALLLHGDTHQYDGVTGLDTEFWDANREGPVPNDSAAWVRSRVEQALHEMWAVGLHPLGWVTPQYSASPLDYQLFGDYFSLFSERRIYEVWEGSDYQQWAPYVINSDVFGSRIIPDTLGYVKDPAYDPGRMVRDASALLTVRGGIVGGFVHLAVTPKEIGWLIERLHGLGYGWFDVRTVPSVVRANDVVQVSGGASAGITVPEGASVEQQVVDQWGALVRSSVEPSQSGSRLASSASLPEGQVLTVAASTGRSRLLAPPPVADGPSTLLRLIASVLGRGVAMAATAGVAAILLSYLLLKAGGRRRRAEVLRQ